MSQKQLQRIVVIENAVAGRVSVAEAAKALGRKRAARPVSAAFARPTILGSRS